MKRHRNKTLLISPPWVDYQSPSLAIGHLAAFARMHGFHVDARHMHLEVAAELGLADYDDICDTPSLGDACSAAILFPKNRKRFLKYIGRSYPDACGLVRRFEKILVKLSTNIEWSDYNIVGFSTNHDQLFTSLLLCLLLKRRHPDIKTVLGGRNVASGLGESVLKLFPQVDWCIDGEGENTLIELLRSHETGKIGWEREVPGLMYKKTGKIVLNARTPLEHLNSFPDPDYKHYFELLQNHPKLCSLDTTSYIPVEAIRGCNYRCSFCSDYRYLNDVKPRSGKEIADSISRLHDRFRVTSVYLAAQMIGPEHCKEIFSSIRNLSLDLKIFCEIRAGMPFECLRLMKQAGVSEVQIGIESLHTPLLRKMNKQTRFIDNLETLKFCEELGIRHSSNLIVGHPGETKEDILSTVRNIDVACSYMPPVNLAKFILYHNSSIDRNPSRHGVSHIDARGPLGPLLPRTISKHFQSFRRLYRTSGSSSGWKRLSSRWEEWKRRYDEAMISGQPLLCYFDVKSRLLVEDNREGPDNSRQIVLKGIERKIVLYCEKIRHVSDIFDYFSPIAHSKVLRSLHRLKRLTLLHQEGKYWLSLAIRGSSAYRSNMPFQG